MTTVDSMRAPGQVCGLAAAYAAEPALALTDGHVELFLTDDGSAQPWERWYESALPLAATLALAASDDRRGQA